MYVSASVGIIFQINGGEARGDWILELLANDIADTSNLLL